MREAGWNEIFAPRADPLVVAPEVPREPTGWRRLLWWEDWLTLLLLGFAELAVIGSIHRAQWVDDMPSLYVLSFFGLFAGWALARLPWPEGFVHLLALPIGVAASLWQVLAAVPGSSPVDRFQTLTTRMGDWFHAASSGGISNDPLPFIVLVVPLVWLAAYLSSWAVFRWHNAWLGLVPGGGALLLNISLLSGSFSFAFIVFLVAGSLLVTRMHLVERARTWRSEGTPYPGLLSLSVLHASFWAALVLIAFAWLLPQANEADAFEWAWRRATAPVTERAEGLGRLFVGVHAKKPLPIHRFEGALPFQGSVSLPDAVALEALTRSPGKVPYLRADVYEVYTPAGWEQQGRREIGVDQGRFGRVEGERDSVTVRIVATGRTGDTIFSLGQPAGVDRPVRIVWGPEGVTSVRAGGDLEDGDAYEATGNVSVATDEDLRNAGVNYPDWVRERYLQLPEDFPQSVRDLARGLAGSEPTPYDKALAIQTYLRRIPYTLDVPQPPPGRDAIEYFLFDAQRGYFDYHASAMVVMLRELKVPARLAVGYVLDEAERDEGSGSYGVTEQSAFAWPEVYFPGFGWIEFNPTPNQPPIVRGGSGGGVSSSFAPDGGAAGRSSGDDLAGGVPFPDAPGRALPDVRPSAGQGRWVLIALAAAAALALAAGAGGLRYAWVRGLADLEEPSRLWAKTVRLASWTRLGPRPSQTPREYAAELRGRVAGAADVSLLADAYVRQRYGRTALDEGEGGRLEEAWRTVRGALLRRLFRLS